MLGDEVTVDVGVVVVVGDVVTEVVIVEVGLVETLVVTEVVGVVNLHVSKVPSKYEFKALFSSST